MQEGGAPPCKRQWSTRREIRTDETHARGVKCTSTVAGSRVVEIMKP